MVNISKIGLQVLIKSESYTLIEYFLIMTFFHIFVSEFSVQSELCAILMFNLIVKK